MEKFYIEDFELIHPISGRAHMVYIEGDISLGYSAPVTNNPNSPGYSDPGDPGDVEFDIFFQRIVNGKEKLKKINFEKIKNLDIEKLTNEIFEIAEQKIEDNFSDVDGY